MLGHDRNPEIFIQVLSDLIESTPNFVDDLIIKLAGSVDYSVKNNFTKFGLDKNIEYLGTIKRDDALQLTLDSSLLLLPLNIADNAKGRIPGKLFEQMRTYNPILCLGPNGSDVEKIITETNTGRSFEYDDYEGIKTYILNIYKAYKENKIFLQHKNIEKYSVKKQVEKLAKYLDEITDK